MRAIMKTISVVVAIAACSKPAAVSKAAADSASMANMPGMAAPANADSANGANAPLPVTITFSASQVQHGGVRWAAAIVGMAASSAIVPGTLTPNEDRTARLGAPARGRVIDVRVQPGDRVERGSVLVTLQSTDAGMAQSDQAKAAAEVTARRAQAQYAASARARAERLLALKAIPRQDYERAVADDEQAQASLIQGDAEVQRALNASQQLGAASSASGEIALRAPRAGVVLARFAVPGSVVEAGTPLVVVTDPASLWLRVNAPEQMASLFAVGGALRFSVPAYPGETFSARIDAVSPGLDPDTRTLMARGEVAGGSKLKSEMLASVTVGGGPKMRAVLIPDDAVQLVDGTPTVFLARPDGKGGAVLERRAVEVGSRAAGRIAVFRGLAAGDMVVIAGAFAVKAEFQKGKMPKMEM
jgi:cobalt-zinc-cadmium efflux system membrane fusion protein